MAGLQLAPHLPVAVMFPHNKTEAPGLHSAKQDPYEQGDSSQRSSMGHLRKNFQQKVLNSREVELDDVCTQPKWNTYLHSAGISQKDPDDSHGQGKGLFYPSSPQPPYPKANDQDFTPFAKKRIGVDRAYPLKPMVHRKSRSMGETGTDGNQNVCPRPSEPRQLPDSNFGLRSWVKSSVLAAMQAEKVMADLHRTEWTQIRRLEAAGESLEREIRRKEILLREKLKKTEEGLRRIQKEKEQVKENEDRELQRMALSRRVQGSNSQSACKPVLSPEFRSEQVFSEDQGDDDTWGRPQESSSPIQFSDYGMHRLKRERLMANNNRIQDRASGPLAEKVFQPSEELRSAFRGSSPSSSLFRTPSSLGSSSSSEAAELGKCNHCGRTFLLLRLERHSRVCSRMQRSKRKVFDSSRARAKGTELEWYLYWKGPAAAKAEAPPKSTWRQKHESFIRMLRQARQTQQVMAKGGNPSDLPSILPVENPDYVQCPHCSRHFAPKVAERHIPKCKTIKSRPPPPRKHDS